MLLFERSTPGAFLTGIFCVYLHDLPTSVRSFVVKHMDEGRPPDILNGFGKEASRQTFDVEVFDGNHAKVLHQPIRPHVLKVSALIGNVLMRSLQ
jgi:hypothetical protein